MIRFLIPLLFIIATSDATFFNGGCGCAPPPICLPPPPPLCMTTIQLPPIQVPVIPLPRIELPQPCCPTCACGKKRKRDTSEINESTNSSVSSSSCNSDELLSIMKKEMTSKNSSEIKINLVEAAEQNIGGKFTVICSSGSFSFVTSTSSYCLHSQNGLNCYLFKTQ